MSYPTYLIHYGIPGQKWGNRRYQNEDGSWTEEGLRRRREQFISETRETAYKVAGIIASTHGDKSLSQKDMRKLVNKYRNYEDIDKYKKEHPDEWKEFMRKVNKDDGFNKSHDKLREWEEIERSRIKNPKELYSERANRKAWLKASLRISDEAAETRLEYIDKKIDTYKKSIETYLNSSDVRKTMKELNVELKDIYDEKEHAVKEPTNGQYIVDGRTWVKIGNTWSGIPGDLSEEEKNRKIKSLQEEEQKKRLEEFRKKYGY